MLTKTTRISKCTSGNINQLLQGFSIDALPALYRDAVIMTQKLGKRYVVVYGVSACFDADK